jgi:hypothetical protein
MTPIVSIAEARTHLRVYDSTDDTYIGNLIQASQEWIQAASCIEFVNTAHTLVLDRFPGGHEMWDFNEWAPARIFPDLWGKIRFPLGPVSAVSSVTYYDADNASQTLASTNYSANTRIKPATLSLSSTGTWPATYDREDAVTIAYTAGYGASAANVPYQIKQVVLLIVGDWYGMRENTVMPMGQMPTEIPMGARRLIAAFGMREAP